MQRRDAFAITNANITPGSPTEGLNTDEALLTQTNGYSQDLLVVAGQQGTSSLAPCTLSCYYSGALFILRALMHRW